MFTAELVGCTAVHSTCYLWWLRSTWTKLPKFEESQLLISLTFNHDSGEGNDWVKAVKIVHVNDELVLQPGRFHAHCVHVVTMHPVKWTYILFKKYVCHLQAIVMLLSIFSSCSQASVDKTEEKWSSSSSTSSTSTVYRPMLSCQSPDPPSSSSAAWSSSSPSTSHWIPQRGLHSTWQVMLASSPTTTPVNSLGPSIRCGGAASGNWTKRMAGCFFLHLLSRGRQMQIRQHQDN